MWPAKEGAKGMGSGWREGAGDGGENQTAKAADRATAETE